METNYLLTSLTSKRLYHAAQQMPIIDYPCHLSHMGRSQHFGIDKSLCRDTADEILEETDAYITNQRVSPVALIENLR